jgi:hypothetical protein
MQLTSAHLTIRPGALEALKWIGLAAMLGDHVDKALFGDRFPGLSDAGRIAFPLFALVFGYNLARTDAHWPQTYRRVLVRLLLFGLVALPFSVLAFQRWDLLPLNILFTLALGLGLIWCIRRNDLVAALVAPVLFLGGGLLVEFSWPGLLLLVACWACFARPGAAAWLGALASLALLFLVNGNHYALLALPVAWAVVRFAPELPRHRWVFYVFYPAHLAALAALRYLLPGPL